MSWLKRHAVLSAAVIFVVLTIPSAINTYWDLYEKFKGVPMPSLNLGAAIWVLPVIALIFFVIIVWQVRTSSVPHQYISDTHIKGRVLNLMDLVSPGTKPVISNRTIEDCEIRGPAMIYLSYGTVITHSSFDGDINSLFVEVPENRMILGAIGLENCVIRKCRFLALGIIGTREQIERAKRGFKTV